jgi:hypothetical protein
MRTISEVIIDGEDKLNELCSIGANYAAPIELNSFPLPKGSDTAALERIMHQMQLEGQLETVVNVIQQTEKILEEYKKDSLFYRILFPCPLWITRAIKNKFDEDENTKSMYKYLYISWKQQLSNMIYCISGAILGLFLLVLAFIPSYFWIPLLMLVCSIAIQVKVFEDTIENIAFTRIHNSICAVFEKTYENHLNFVMKTLELPQKIKEIEMAAMEKTAAEFARLEGLRCLGDLSALVAIHQATSDAEVKMISDNTSLVYLERELGIRDDIDRNKRGHEIALSRVNSMGAAVIEMAKAATMDDLKGRDKKRDLDYQLHLINGMRGDFQTNGADAMNNESIYDSLEKIRKQMMEDFENPQEI